MYMDRAEPNLPSAAIVIPQLRRADICGNSRKKAISYRKERALILGQIEKKYGVLVREIREGNDISYLISRPAVHRSVEPRSFMVGKYTNEHMMRHFARYLNRGKLSRENINATIYKMKWLQTFCR